MIKYMLAGAVSIAGTIMLLLFMTAHFEYIMKLPLWLLIFLAFAIAIFKYKYVRWSYSKKK